MGDSHLSSHTLLKVPFSLPAAALKTRFARAMELMRTKTTLAAPDFTPGTNTVTGDYDQSHDSDDEPETKSEGLSEGSQHDEDDHTVVESAEPKAETEAEEQHPEPEPLPEPLSCQADCEIGNTIHGTYFRCIECPGAYR